MAPSAPIPRWDTNLGRGMKRKRRGEIDQGDKRIPLLFPPVSLHDISRQQQQSRERQRPGQRGWAPKAPSTTQIVQRWIISCWAVCLRPAYQATPEEMAAAEKLYSRGGKEAICVSPIILMSQPPQLQKMNRKETRKHTHIIFGVSLNKQKLTYISPKLSKIINVWEFAHIFVPSEKLAAAWRLASLAD